MPNGDPDFGLHQKPKLERFFRVIATVLEGFARRHNLRIEKYYHQSPSWSFLFRHPKGGTAKVEVHREGEVLLRISWCWWYDDFDAATRWGRTVRRAPMALDSQLLDVELETALSDLLSSRFGEWDESHTGYTQWKKTWTKEQFERLRDNYPEPLR